MRMARTPAREHAHSDELGAVTEPKPAQDLHGRL